LDTSLLLRPPVYRDVWSLDRTGDMNVHSSSYVITFIVQQRTRPARRLTTSSLVL